MNFLLIKRPNGCQEPANKIMELMKCDIEEKELKYDGYIIIGGDGTVLHSLLYKKNLPNIYAINCGNLGFLCPIDQSEIPELVDKLKNNTKFNVFMRKRLCLNDKIFFLNEAVLTSNGKRLNKFKIVINDTELFVNGDAVIVATQTGSTSYNSSIGGPILLMDAIIVNVVSPNRCNFKPLVCDINSKINIEIIDDDPFIIVDGIITKENRLEVNFSGDVVNFAYLSEYNLKDSINQIYYLKK